MQVEIAKPDVSKNGRMVYLGVGALILLVAVAIVMIVAFEVFCLRDLAKAQDDELLLLNRPGWTVVIVLAIPVGGLGYLFFGRRR